MVDRLNEVKGAQFTLTPVTNHTYGPVTTVTGLLAWSDIAAAIEPRGEKDLYIPDVLLTADGRFIDDITVGDAAAASGRRIHVVSSNAAGLASLLD